MAGKPGPKPRPLTTDQAAALDAVRRAAEARREAQDVYVAEILAARETGATFAAIAEAAEVTDDAIGQIIRRRRTK